MKKFILIASALCLAMMVSCNKVAEDRITPSGDGSASANLVEFSFPVNQELTKAYLDGTTFKWKDGDKVALCYGSTVAPFTYNPEKDVFQGELDASAAGPFYVVSPYSADIALAGGKVQATLPAEQVADDHGADPAAFLAVGQAADAAALEAGVSLRNAFSLVRVTITDADVTSISFEGNPDGAKISEPLAGPVEIDPSDASFVCDSRNTAVTLKPSGAAFAAGTYDIAVLPQNLANGMKIVFKRDGEDQAYYKKSDAAKQLERNKGLEFPSFTVSGITTRCRYIQNAADMQAWDAIAYAEFTADDVIYLGEDIDMDGVTGWVPVNQFIGTFDGQNHRIYNFQISSNEYVGMFRVNKNSTDKADIKNLVFGSKDGASWDGVSNITHATSKSTGWYYLGVIGKTQGNATMENIINFAKVEVGEAATAKTRIAGICGNWASPNPLKNCTNYGSVSNLAASGDGNGVAGIVAQVDEACTIEGCVNYGTVLNANSLTRFVGGVVGCSSKVLTIKNCEQQGDLKVTAMKVSQWGATGGLIGYVVNSTVQDCKVIGSTVECEAPLADLVSGDEWKVPLGGFIGYSEKNTIKDCYIENSDIISTCWCVGGFVGDTEIATLFENCSVSNCTVKGYNNIGGFLGYDLQKSNFKNCRVNQSTVTGNQEVGGVAGLLQRSRMADCKAIFTTVTASKKDAGGIVGYMKYYQVSEGVYEGCFVDGCKVTDGCSISGTQNIGGVVGWLDIGEVTNCTLSNASTVVASSDGVGGIVGRAIAKYGEPNLIENCFVEKSTVTGTYSVGGIVGYEYPDSNGPVDIYNCGVSASSTLRATSCDTGGDPTKGDSMIGGIVGWARCSDSASSFKIVNCYSHAPITCDLDMSHPSAGGMVGYVSLSSAGTGEISNCTSSLTATDLMVGGAPVANPKTCFGAIFGKLPNHAGISVANCYYMSGKGLGIGDSGASVVLSGNEAFEESVFKNGSTVVGKLNLFAGSYTGHQLFGWKAESGLPVLSDAVLSTPGGGVEEYGDDVPFTW